MKQENYILNTFLRLTSKTYPFNTENELVNDMIKSKIFPKDIQEDKHGNYFYKIGRSRTMFTAHLDTSGHERRNVKHVIDKNIVKTDGKTILGADDKAGVTIMLYMINHKIPGLYYFFIGEETGCIGSGKLAKYGDLEGKYDRVVSFDRRNTGSVITYQSFTRCCSDTFANALADQLNKSGLEYKIDEGGIYTDSAEFTEIIPECTNLSVGYYKEHTSGEYQDIEHLEKLANACLSVKWETLPIKRDKSKTEYKSYSYINTSTYKPKTDLTYYGNRVSDYRQSNAYKQNRYGLSDDYSGYGNGYNWMDNPENDDWNWDQRDRVSPRRGSEDYTGFTMKNGRKARKAKKYYDNGDGSIIEISDNKNYYEAITNKILDGGLTKKDLDIIKKQYLDMSNSNDRSFHQYLLDNVID